MKNSIKIIAPLKIILPRKTKKDRTFYLNLNGYRNWHFLISNELKKRYKEQLREQLDGLRFSSPISLTFILYKGSNRRSDRANVLSVQEKFFCDALTECGCIPDDSDDFIKETRYITGGVDKDYPRVEIIISTKDAND